MKSQRVSSKPQQMMLKRQRWRCREGWQISKPWRSQK